ncbi:hypothetical protein V8F44DRAFT_632582 [Aspergillus fumigatus]
MVTFVIVYYKGFYASNDVGELVVWYIWLVMLFINYQAVYGSQAAQGRQAAWLWGPDPGIGCKWLSEWFWEPSTVFPHNIQEAEAALAAMDTNAEEGMDIKHMHQFLGFHTPGPLSILGKWKQALWEDEAECMTGWPNIQFQGVQDPAMQAIHRGKSILFIVPIFTTPGGTIIIIVPLELGILYIAWESWQPLNAISIILVTPKSAVSPNF